MANDFKRQIKLVVGMFLPYSLVKLWQQRTAEHNDKAYRQRFDAQHAHSSAASQAYSYDAAVLALQTWGLDPLTVIRGSIPAASLELCGDVIDKYLVHTLPLIGLHIGNFVGVSVCFFLDRLARRHPGSLLVSIDPNIIHLEIEHPQQYVTHLAAHFGLAEHHLLLTGYTLEKNVAQYDAKAWQQTQSGLAHMAQQTAPEKVLPGLAQLGLRFDFTVIDGNHDAAYLAREVSVIKGMLADSALLIFDDVNEHWDRIETFFKTLLLDPAFTLVGRDDRLGILRYQKK